MKRIAKEKINKEFNNQQKIKKLRNKKGITLIALVVTIILLLIIAGVSISFLWNGEGMINIANTAGENYRATSAREKLEMILSEIEMKKYKDKTYNEQEYIDKELAEQGITKISGDIFLVDKYQFEIDRSIPRIVNELGVGEINQNIEMKTAEEITTGPYVVGKIHLEISYDNELSEVTINGEKVAKLEKAEDGKTYIIEQEVSKNGTYHILAKDAEGNYNITSVKVNQITEDMEIWNKADLETFRRKVNEEGRTFENRTAKVMQDIVLSNSEETGETKESWQPIGTTDKSFKGTFDGDNHKITGLYINATETGQGLFGVNDGIIQNFEMEDAYLKTNTRDSGLVAGYNQGTIRSITTRGELNGYTQIGGVCGMNYASIENCTNYANITYNKEGTYKISGYYAYGWNIGGIVGINYAENAKIERCTNYGDIIGTHAVGGIAGDTCCDKFVAGAEEKINLCINYGTITGENTEEWPAIGGITGHTGWRNNVTISNSINVGIMKTSTNVGTRGSIGGINGYCVSENTGRAIIKNCYVLGTITAISNNKGAIIADKGSGTVTLNKNYWLSGCGATIGNKPGNSNTNAEPKSIEEFEKMAQDLIASENEEEKELGNLLKQAIEVKKNNG